jgi:hypothetical protein
MTTSEGPVAGWVGEVIWFVARDVEYRFDLNDATPGEATFAWITQNGYGTFVDLTTARLPVSRMLPRGTPLLRKAVGWLREFRGVQTVLVWDSRARGYCRLPADDLG